MKERQADTQAKYDDQKRAAGVAAERLFGWAEMKHKPAERSWGKDEEDHGGWY